MNLRPPTDPAAKEFAQAKPAAGRVAPERRPNDETQAEPESSRLGAQQDEPLPKDQPPGAETPRARRDQKKPEKKKPKRDEYGVYYTDEGEVDRSKMPPMGG